MHFHLLLLLSSFWHIFRHKGYQMIFISVHGILTQIMFAYLCFISVCPESKLNWCIKLSKVPGILYHCLRYQCLNSKTVSDFFFVYLAKKKCFFCNDIWLNYMPALYDEIAEKRGGMWEIWESLVGRCARTVLKPFARDMTKVQQVRHSIVGNNCFEQWILLWELCVQYIFHLIN